MKTIRKVFSLLPNPAEGIVERLLINKELRGIEAVVSFPVLKTHAEITAMEEEIEKRYRLSGVTIKPCYSSDLLTEEYINEAILFAARMEPMIGTLLTDAEIRLSGDALYITPRMAAIDLVHESDCAMVLEEVFCDQFDRDIKVHIGGEENISDILQEQAERNDEVISASIAEVAVVKENPVIHGKEIKGEPIPMREVNMEAGRVIVEGEIFDMEARETRRGTMILRFDMTDKDNSVTCKLLNLPPDRCKAITKRLSIGSYIAVRGMAAYDSFDKETTILADDIMQRDREERMDNAPEKRVELHLHTQMSSMDGFTDIKALIKRANKWGHRAVAITDHGVVQNFPFAEKAAKGTDLKLIYGVEGYLINDSLQIVTGADDRAPEESVVVFDIETTGLRAATDKIIEIGAVKITKGEITDRFSTFIDPQMPIPPKITELTRINDSMVAGQETIETVLPRFLEFCGDSLLVAHNAPFDCGFIRAACSALSLPFNFSILDTLELSRALFPQLKKHKLNIVAEHLEVSLEGHHRAVNDAEATALIYLKCCKLMKEQGVTALDQVNTAFGDKVDFRKQRYTHIILLAKNRDGLRNLYKLITASHIEFFHKKPLIPKSRLLQLKEGLIIGSACEQGELYRAILNNAPFDEILKIAALYDYFEIQPIGNNEFMIRNGEVADEKALQDLNRSIVRLGEKLEKPVVATCDVHFLDPEDAKFRAVLMGGQGFDDADNQAPLYYRTTEEMLAEFAYLGKEKAYEVVVTNTNKIADMIESFPLLPKGLCPPIIEEAPDEIRRMSYEKAHEIYGDPLPEIVEARIDKELSSIITYGFSVMYYIAHKLVKKSNEDGYLVGSRGSVGSSFIAFLTGITEVNALPPHYVCRSCKHSEFITDGTVGCGIDMEDKLCSVCGQPYYKDGHDIPFETFLGFKGDKVPDIDLNFSGMYQQQAHKYTEVLFGEGNTYKAGTIGTLQDKTVYGFVKHYLEERGITAGKAEVNRLIKGCVGVKRTTGQHPGGIIVVPRGRDIHEFCPVQKPADKTESDVTTTHFDFHSIDSNLLKLDLLGHDDPSMIRMLQELTGIDPKTIPLDDKETMSLFTGTQALGVTPEQIKSETGTFGVPEFGTGFVRQMLLDTKPTTFSELVRISGLSHGTDVWLGNAQDLIVSGTATLKEAICTRDDIMTYLIYRGLPSKSAFDIMERVRKGKGLTEEDVVLMKENDVPQWYIDSCNKIKYMFPKAHAAAYVTMAYRIAYCKVHHPKAYYIAHFTVRADEFDIEMMSGGYHAVMAKRAEMEAQGNNLSAKDKNVLTILEMVSEMNARGIEFLPIDLYESDATKFRDVEGGILPPLVAIPGLGEKAAEYFVQEREKAPFENKDELRDRGKLSKTLVEALEKLGCLEGMPESSQMSFFDL